MSTTQDDELDLLLRRVKAAGLVLSVRGGKLRVEGVAAVRDAYRDELRLHRDLIIETILERDEYLAAEREAIVNEPSIIRVYHADDGSTVYVAPDITINGVTWPGASKVVKGRDAA